MFQCNFLVERVVVVRVGWLECSLDQGDWKDILTTKTLELMVLIMGYELSNGVS
ncbi:hypothetical protein KR52_01980 [Synechococcus sp. KORDI-52]|nr:hypothetical protein KR52_01980 [Synechococcus sp. KORDI-52]